MRVRDIAVNLCIGVSVETMNNISPLPLPEPQLSSAM